MFLTVTNPNITLSQSGRPSSPVNSKSFRSPSPNPNKSLCSKKPAFEKEDPSPLICQRKLGECNSPPRVIKKKAPTPEKDGQHENTSRGSEGESSEKKSADRPRVISKKPVINKEGLLDAKTAGQVTFAQERQTSISEISRKSGQDKGIREGPKPQDAIPRPHGKLSSSSEVLKGHAASNYSLAPAQSEHKCIPKLELPMVRDSYNDMYSSSTQKVVGSQSPQTLRPINRIEDVNTIKRQPKAGWL